jgi:peptide/nickel transport system substrate-binding protein
MRSRLLSGLVALLLLFTAVSCKERTVAKPSEPVSDKPAYGDTFVEGSIAEPSTLIPVLASDSASRDIIGLVFNGLVK